MDDLDEMNEIDQSETNTLDEMNVNFPQKDWWAE